MKPLTLIYGLRPIRVIALVLDLQLNPGVSPQLGALGTAVVGQDPLNGHSAGVEPLDFPDRDSSRGDNGSVVVDVGVGAAGVVDDSVDVDPAH